MELFMNLNNPLDDLLVLVDEVMELGRSMCAACGAVRKEPKRKPLPSPGDVPVRVKMPRGEPHPDLQAVVNLSAGFVVCPVPPPVEVEVEPEHYPFALTTVTVKPVATAQMRNKWASASVDKIQARLAEIQVLIADNELDLACALREGKSKKIETAEASLSWFLHHKMMLESLVASKQGLS